MGLQSMRRPRRPSKHALGEPTRGLATSSQNPNEAAGSARLRRDSPREPISAGLSLRYCHQREILRSPFESRTSLQATEIRCDLNPSGKVTRTSYPWFMCTNSNTSLTFPPVFSMYGDQITGKKVSDARISTLNDSTEITLSSIMQSNPLASTSAVSTTHFSPFTTLSARRTLSSRVREAQTS